MELTFGTSCRTGGDTHGTLWGVTVEPREKLFLRAIIEQPQADPLVRKKVPFGRLDRADSDQVTMSVSPKEFAGMPEYEAVEEADFGPDDGSRRSRRRRRGDELVERVYTGATRVFCRDGEAGRLCSVHVDARSGDVEEVRFEIGSAMDRKVTVPVSKIEDFASDRISLELDKDHLAEY